MKRRFITALVLGLLLCQSSSVCASDNMQTTDENDTQQEITLDVNNLQETDSAESEENVISDKAKSSYKIQRETEQYVTVEYPVLEAGSDCDENIAEKINTAFSETALSYLEEEKTSMVEIEQEVKEYNPDSVQYLMSELTCQNVYLEGTVYSVHQSYYSYTGGAHGYGYSVGTSYDLSTGELMTMEQLLGCDEETMREAVVEAYRQDIIDQIENITESSIRDSFDSMAYWMTEDGMMVSIPAYAIASYAAGPQEALVTPDLVQKVQEEENAANVIGGQSDEVQIDVVSEEAPGTSQDTADDSDDIVVQIDNGNQATTSGDEVIIDGNTVSSSSTDVQAQTSTTVTIINGIQADAADFIFPYSGQVLLTDEDLARLEGADVEENHYNSQLAINEMLARYGYAFKPEYGGSGKEAYDHFNGLAWYEQAKVYCPYDTANDVLYNCLNSIELKNVDLICSWQQEHGCYY